MSATIESAGNMMLFGQIATSQASYQRPSRAKGTPRRLESWSLQPLSPGDMRQNPASFLVSIAVGRSASPDNLMDITEVGIDRERRHLQSHERIAERTKSLASHLADSAGRNWPTRRPCTAPTPVEPYRISFDCLRNCRFDPGPNTRCSAREGTHSPRRREELVCRESAAHAGERSRRPMERRRSGNWQCTRRTFRPGGQ